MPNYPRKKEPQAFEPELLPRLTPRQARFVRYYLAGKSCQEAYRLAYDAAKMQSNSIAVASSRLLADPKISLCIRAIQRAGFEESAVNRENHLAELARLREIAVENQQVSAGVQAEHYRGRVAGLYENRLHLQVGPSDESLLSQIAALLGPDMAKSLGKAMGYGEAESLTLSSDDDSQLLKLPPPGSE